MREIDQLSEKSARRFRRAFWFLDSKTYPDIDFALTAARYPTFPSPGRAIGRIERQRKAPIPDDFWNWVAHHPDERVGAAVLRMAPVAPITRAMAEAVDAILAAAIRVGEVWNPLLELIAEHGAWNALGELGEIIENRKEGRGEYEREPECSLDGLSITYPDPFWDKQVKLWLAEITPEEYDQDVPVPLSG